MNSNSESSNLSFKSIPPEILKYCYVKPAIANKAAQYQIKNLKGQDMNLLDASREELIIEMMLHIDLIEKILTKTDDIRQEIKDAGYVI